MKPFLKTLSRLILFRLDASHKRGMGHLYRMIILANEFRKNDFQCLFLLRDNEIAKRILNAIPHNHLSYPPNHSEDEIINRYFAEHPKPALWIFDILTPEKEWISRVKKNGTPVICFDSLKDGLTADLAINPIVGCWKASKTKSNSYSRILSGPKYSIIDPHIAGLEKKERLLNGPIKIAVTMGGSDTHGATIKLAEILSKIKERLEVIFFLGPHFLHKKELSEIIHELSFPYSIKNAVKNFHAELIKSDAVICGGGQTLFEVCAMKMPILAIANEDHEEKTISYFSQRGACIDIGAIHKIVKDEEIQLFFRNIRSNPEEIMRMGISAKRLVDGKGVFRCLNKCMKVIQRNGYQEAEYF